MQQLKQPFTIILLFIVVLLSSGCASYTAKRQIEKGNYVNSLQVMATDLTKKGRFTSERHREKTVAIMQTALDHIEGLPSVTARQTTIRYEQLLQAYPLLANKFFSSEFKIFLQSYDVMGLRTSVAKGYYQQAMEVPETSHYAYKEKALLLATGAKYFNYNNMQALSQEYAKKYALAAAEIEYQNALASERAKNYKLAAEHLAKVKEIFKEFGEYKDSHARFIKNDKAWRGEEMNKALQTAGSLSQPSSTKANYRKASAWYIYADDIYKPYGGNANALELAKQSWARGVITVGYIIEADVNKSNATAHSQIEKVISATFSESYFLLRPNSRGDITLDIRYGISYKESRNSPQTTVQSYVDEQGKTRSYTQVTQYFTQQADFFLNLDTFGEVRHSRNFLRSKDSSDQSISYSGAVPSGLSNQKAQLKSQSYLENYVINKVTDELTSYLTNILYLANKV
ncbi:hypothetical protein VQ643_01875 [Pseudomonas sp. F1_0610]|uniref:hypothetical protein n=1 Tax=Pseudomonas sp. F1_0610 TaxID=3114284 RepID=UPI0039C108ED